LIQLSGIQLRFSAGTLCSGCCFGGSALRIFRPKVVVDVDLEKFFDRVDHDILIDRLGKRIADRPLYG